MSGPGTINLSQDIPHVLEHLLLRYAKKERSEQCYVAPDAICYDFAKSVRSDTLRLNRIIVCGKPIKNLTFLGLNIENSGAHRIIIDAIFYGSRFLLAIEEIEDSNCAYVKEKVFLGYFDDNGKYLSSIDAGDLVLRIIAGVVYLTTGLRAKIDDTAVPAHSHAHRISLPTYEPRFSVELVDPAEILSSGCNLSPDAMGCFIYNFYNPFD